MPSICTVPGVNDRPNTEVIPFPVSAGTTLFAAVTAIVGDTLGAGSAAFSGIANPFIATPTGWTKIAEDRIAAANTGANDDGVVLAMFSRQIGAAVDVQFTSIPGGINCWWSTGVVRLTGGSAGSHIPTAGGVIQNDAPVVQGAGRLITTASISPPDPSSFLVYVGCSPDSDDTAELDLVPPGMTLGVVSADTGGLSPTNPFSGVAVFYEQLVNPGATGTRAKTYRNTGGAGNSVGALTSLLTFR